MASQGSFNQEPSGSVSRLPLKSSAAFGQRDVEKEEIALYSCSIWSKTNPIRRAALNVVGSKAFVNLMFLVIALNAAFLAMWDPVADLYQLKSIRNTIMTSSELFFQLSYTIEMGLKMIAYGVFWEGKTTYFRRFWNWFDFAVVVLGWIAFILDLTTESGSSPLLRVIRVLRPLRGIQYIPGLEVLNNTVIRSLEQLGDVFLFLLLAYYFFSVVGISLFKGRLHQRCGWLPSAGPPWRLYADTADQFCSLSPAGGFKCPDVFVLDPITNASCPVSCVTEFPGPNSGMTGFDNFFQAIITVFIIVTLEGWTDVMYWYSDALSQWSQLYFFALVLFGSFIVLSLIVALLTVNYSAEREKVQMTKSAEMKKKIIADLQKSAEIRHKALVQARLNMLRDVELRLICSFDKYSSTPGYNTVTPDMYERYKSKYTETEITGFAAKVSKAMLRRRKALHPEGELHLFDASEASMSETRSHSDSGHDGKEGSESSIPPSATVVMTDTEKVIDDVPEFISNKLADGEAPPPRPRKYMYDDQYGIPWGEDNTMSLVVRVSYAIAMNAAFRFFIWICIVANTVLLGYDHFLQPIVSIFISGILNKIFTAIYTVEAALKITGFGPSVYFADRFNGFDFFVVIVAWLEVLVSSFLSGSTASAATSAFRVVRLMRVLRLAQFWASLKTLLRTIVRTFKGVYPFSIMFAVFMYVFMVSGLQILGGLIVVQPTVVNPVSLEAEPNPDFDCTRLAGNFYFSNITHCPNRSNYDTLLWSFVTSFQLLTRENWNQLLYDTVDSTGTWTPTIYYVLVVVVGSFVVLNLFLAILIDSFMSVHEQERQVTKELLEKKRKLRQERKAKRKERLYMKQLNGETSEKVHLTENSLRRMDSATSLAMSTKTSQSGAENSDGGLRTWVKARLVKMESERRALSLSKYPAFEFSSLFIFTPHNAFRVWCAWISTAIAFQLFVIMIIAVSCIILIIDVPGASLDPIQSAALNGVNVFCVAIFVLEMALKAVGFGWVMHPGSYLRDPWNVMDFVIVVLSIADLAVSNQPGLSVFKAARALRPLKLIKHIEGMRVAVKSLLRAVVPVSQIALIAIMFYFIFAVVATALFGGKLYGCYICDSDSCQLPQVNATLGLAELRRVCYPYRTYDVSACNPESQCVGGFSFHDPVSGDTGTLAWQNPSYDGGSEYSFDNVLVSMILLYEVSSTELWLSTMASVTDITGYGRTPVRSGSETNSLFFVVFIFFTNFFLLQLFVASVIDAFSETDMKYSGQAFMTQSQFDWIQTQHQVNKLSFSRSISPPSRSWRRSVFSFVMSNTFEYFILAVIVINSVVLAADHYDIDPVFENFLIVADYVFGAIYIGEFLLRFIAFGRQYFRIYWFDFAILVSIVLTWGLSNTDAAAFFTIFEVFRLFRIWRVIRKHQGIANLVSTLAFSIPALVNISMLVFLLYFVFTVIGIQLFGNIPSTSAIAAHMGFINSYANFQTFANAIMTLFRMSTGESWNGLMRDLALESAAAWPYCIIFNLLIQFVFMNLFVAIVIANFNAVLTKSKKDVISKKALYDFVRAWQDQTDLYEKQIRATLAQTHKAMIRSTVGSVADDATPAIAPATDLFLPDERCYRLALLLMDSTYLPASSFCDFFVRLGPPLGLPLARTFTPSDMMRFIRIANIPVTKTGMISARATLSALIDQALGTETSDETYDLLKSALKIKMSSDHKSTEAHSKAEAERALTHSVAEEVAARRLQITARYLLSRKKIEVMVDKKDYSNEQGSEMLEQLSIQYRRQIASSTLKMNFSH